MGLHCRRPVVRSTDVAFGSGSITDAGVNALLRGGVFDAATYTFTGLTPGVEYEVQIFANDARGGGGAGGRDDLWQIGLSDGTEFSVEPVFEDARAADTDIFVDDLANGTAGIARINNRINNVDDPDDPLALTGETSGQHITGTFTADASGAQGFILRGSRTGFTDQNGDEVIDFAGGTAQINAIQLRIAGDEVPAVLGDFNGDMIVDCADLDGYVGNIGCLGGSDPCARSVGHR